MPHHGMLGDDRAVKHQSLEHAPDGVFFCQASAVWQDADEYLNQEQGCPRLCKSYRKWQILLACVNNVVNGRFVDLQVAQA